MVEKNKETDVNVENVEKKEMGVDEKMVKVEKEKTLDEKEEKKNKKNKIPKKDVAVANGFSLKISPKQSIYVCRVVRGKSPEAAIERLQDVISEKRAVPMAALEVGHKKGRGFAGGKFPKNACKAIIEIVKQAGANAIVADIENPVIAIAKADRASAPFRKAGRRAKRTHIHIEVRNKSVVVGRRLMIGGKTGATKKGEKKK